MTQRSNQTWQPTFFFFYTNYLINYFSFSMKLKTIVACFFFFWLKQRLTLPRKKGRKLKLAVSISGKDTEKQKDNSGEKNA